MSTVLQPHESEEYDIIFAGGGTTACVTASRLAAANPALRILIIETGPHTKDDLAHVQPARSVSHLAPESKTCRHVAGRPSEYLNGRSLVVQHGRCVGGGSSINLAMYTRAPASDYDDWANRYNNPGWDFSNLVPMLRKAETYQNALNRPTHGYKGPLRVSYGRGRTNVGDDFLATVEQYDRTRPVVDDANTMVDDLNCYEFWPKWIDNETGRRSDVAHNYLYRTLAHSSNLRLLVGCTVKRVIFENGRAVGVELYVQNLEAHSTSTDVLVARASRLVVVSAGAFGSLAILERSGIGAAHILQRSGIKQVIDLPGVGENYHDHYLLCVPFLAKEGSETLDGISRNDPKEVEKWSVQWHKNGTGLLATNGVDGGMRFRPSPQELRAIGPEFTERWKTFFTCAPDKPLLWFGMLAQYVGMNPPAATQKIYCVGGFSLYPSGVGSVHITSADDVDAPPDFETGVFSCQDDLAVMRYLYKRARECGRRMQSYAGEYAPDHPKFPSGSAAAVREGPGAPVAIDSPDIVYTAEDDQAIDEMLKAIVTTSWHSLGTCAMKPRKQGGVVDPRLNVYGVQGLKVADMSICPSNVGANTYSTAVTIGEKAASIIAEELGLGVEIAIRARL